MSITIETIDNSQECQVYQISAFDHIIKTTVTTDTDEVRHWIGTIERIHRNRNYNLVVGLDTEWRPNFNRYAARNPVSILQLCVGHHCLVFQLQYADDIPQELYEFLSDQDYTFVGVGVSEDIRKLYEDYGLDVQSPVDLRELAADRYDRRDLRNASLTTLAEEVLGLQYNKPRNITVSDWSDGCLSNAQIAYACIDAFLSFEIGKRLNAANP